MQKFHDLRKITEFLHGGRYDTTLELYNILGESVSELQLWNTEMRDFLAQEHTKEDSEVLNVTY